MRTVPVVVVNWNGLEDTRACVRALLEQRGVQAEVHVVDNASAGGEADLLAAEFGSAVVLHRAEQNLGFTGGNNLALRALLERDGGDYVALLNNDAVAEPDWLAALVAAADAHPQAGLVQSRIVFFDAPDRIENAGVDLLPTFDVIPRGRGAPREEFDRSAWVLGACAGAVLLRVRMLEEIGLFREDFFANFEDLDLSLRALAYGWRTRYEPAAVVRHKLNASIARVRDPDFDVRSLRNAAFACLANLPWPVLLLDAPFVAARDLAILLLAPFTGRRGLASSLLRSRRRLLAERGAIAAARRELAPARRTSWWRILCAQRAPWSVNPRLVWNLLRGRQRA